MIETVLVAGAGIGGLTAACRLSQAGFGVEVFEQAAAPGETGAGVHNLLIARVQGLKAGALHLRHRVLGFEETGLGTPSATTFAAAPC